MGLCVFHVVPSSDSSHTSLCFAVMVIICLIAGTAIRNESSPSAYFYVFVIYVPKQLEDNISNANFTVEERGHIIGKRYDGPPWPLLNPEQQFVVGTFSNHPTQHQLIRPPHLTVLIHELAPGCLALRAPPSCY